MMIRLYSRRFPRYVTVLGLLALAIFILSDLEVNVSNIMASNVKLEIHKKSIMGPLHEMRKRFGLHMTRQDGRLLRPFKWKILQKNYCTRDMKTLFVVHTAVDHFAQRKAIRETYAHPHWYEKYKVKTLFAVGRSENGTAERLLTEEALHHKDVIQADFIDAYRNITIKGLMWLRYVRDYCPQVKNIVKLDDDVAPNIGWLMDGYVNNEQMSQPRTYTCLLFYGNVIREGNSKWFVPEAAHPEGAWGRYCSGITYFLTSDMIPDLITRAEKHKYYVSVDDAFLTGTVASEIGAKHDFDKWASMFELNDKHTVEKMLNHKVMFGLVPNTTVLHQIFDTLHDFPPSTFIPPKPQIVTPKHVASHANSPIEGPIPFNT